MSTKSSSPLGGPDTSSHLSTLKYFFTDLSLLPLFLNFDVNLNEENDRLLPLEKMSLFALSFLSNSLCLRTLFSGGVGPDLVVGGLKAGLGLGLGLATSFIMICSGNSWLGDRDWPDSWEGLNRTF